MNHHPWNIRQFFGILMLVVPAVIEDLKKLQAEKQKIGSGGGVAYRHLSPQPVESSS